MRRERGTIVESPIRCIETAIRRCSTRRSKRREEKEERTSSSAQDSSTYRRCSLLPFFLVLFLFSLSFLFFPSLGTTRLLQEVTSSYISPLCELCTGTHCRASAAHRFVNRTTADCGTSGIIRHERAHSPEEKYA